VNLNYTVSLHSVYQTSYPSSIAKFVPSISRGLRHIYPFLNKTSFYSEAFLETRPTPQAGEPLLVGCSRLLIQYIPGYPPYWRSLLHPQPRDAPCRGDRDPVIVDTV